MSKGDFPALRMVVDGGKLTPATPFDRERLNSYRRGTVVFCKFTEEKDRVLVRKWWAILGLVVKQCDTPWKTKEEASEAIKLSLGIVNLGKTAGGQFMQWPKSLTELDDPEMQEALDQMIALLSHMTGVDVDTLKKEASHVGHEIEQPNTGEVPSLDEPVSDAAHPPSRAASEDGGDPLPSPSSSNLFGDEGDDPKATDEEIVKLRRYAKDVLNRAGDPNTSAQLMKTVEARWAEDIKPMSEPAKAIAGSIARSVRAIMKGEVDMSKAIEFHAEGLLCEPAKLEADHG